MKFGVFDHMDASGISLVRQYEERLKLIEAYDRLNFYAYHVAEHHGTPLGLAPSPGIFLAAVAQRTKRLRFGPLVYSLPLYHPIRLIEEICMLDQLSGGRFELGVGRGVSPIEVGFYGVAPEAGPHQFPEALQVIKKGLTVDELTFNGEFYHFEKVPMVLRPVQKPYPPLWYGVTAPATTHWAALEGAHMVTLLPTEGARAVIDRYRSERRECGRSDAADLPLMGVMRLVVLADSDALALKTAERAYKSWLGHMRHLWDRHGLKFSLNLPPEFGPMIEAGAGFAGTAAGFRDFIIQDAASIGANYVTCDVAFGDMTFDEAMRTTELIGNEVIPAFAESGGE
ncbi:MAG TPA: LLM class flavin-dependent oxidoreductase [Steroidobacteraceae bacterium]|jgi:alkanesulfonate monooxygenase SsuD/methylene tetrahydromethanopterin reductase-like flavin-dependent oxidoreductase (luciferase family)|nr:LLM class flavin-dependent oxidoreductase [Steroidobacteraceae bacterium]